MIYLANEHELGDFGVGGTTFAGDFGAMTSERWMQGLFHERGIELIEVAS